MQLDLSLSSDRIKHLLVIGACAGVLFYFVSHGVAGESGFITLSHLEYQLEAAKAEQAELVAAREKLEARTRLLKPDSLDPDMLDERARATLGYTRPSEYVVLFEVKSEK